LQMAHQEECIVREADARGVSRGVRSVRRVSGRFGRVLAGF
jgi:hypothetical protein